MDSDSRVVGTLNERLIKQLLIYNEQPTISIEYIQNVFNQIELVCNSWNHEEGVSELSTNNSIEITEILEKMLLSTGISITLINENTFQWKTMLNETDTEFIIGSIKHLISKKKN